MNKLSLEGTYKLIMGCLVGGWETRPVEGNFTTNTVKRFVF